MDFMGAAWLPWKKFGNKHPSCVLSSTRQHQCIQIQAQPTQETTTRRAQLQEEHSPKMALSIICHQNHTPLVIPIFVIFLLVASFLVSPALSRPISQDSGPLANQTLMPNEKLHKLKNISSFLMKVNKPAIKTIQSPDGDIIDCVKSHLQPAFDHPDLAGGKPLDPPEIPTGLKSKDNVTHGFFQQWTSSGESCPEGTVPIRRTTEKDILRASTTQSFGRKFGSFVRKDSTTDSHEHAVGYATGVHYGAKASVNVWAPHVANPYEFSLSQLWVISGSFGNDLNTIEAGWQVSPGLYGDSNPRFFTYWTSDAYQATGCYNLLCSGFVQINNHIAIGGAISPSSTYRGGQFDISLLIWKDPKRGNWWLLLGDALLGYWPSCLFSHLRNSASMIQFGGEIVNTGGIGHTKTQMGSGHFAEEGYGKASYFRNIQVVDSDNSLIPPNNLNLHADRSECYNIREGVNPVWGKYIYYGGPGGSVQCP